MERWWPSQTVTKQEQFILKRLERSGSCSASCASTGTRSLTTSCRRRSRRAALCPPSASPLEQLALAPGGSFLLREEIELSDVVQLPCQLNSRAELPSEPASMYPVPNRRSHPRLAGSSRRRHHARKGGDPALGEWLGD
jgi:hypothetical protein